MWQNLRYENLKFQGFLFAYLQKKEFFLKGQMQ